MKRLSEDERNVDYKYITVNTENYFTQYGVNAAMLRVSRAADTCVAMVTTVRHA